MAIDFGDIASRYATARLDQATQPFTDPEAYLNNRMMQSYGVDMTGNTKPLSTTISYGDNGQPETVTTKHEVGTPNYTAGADYSLPTPQAQPALGLQMPTAQPVGMTMPAAPVAQAQPAPVTTPSAEAIDQERQRQLQQLQLQQAQQAAPAPVAAPVTPQQVAQQAAPAPAPAPAIVPNQEAVNEVNATQLPQPGAPVQVAGAPGAPMPVTQAAPTAAPVVVPTPAAWQNDLTAIQHDPTRLAAYVGNEANPENARKIASQLWRKQEDLRAKGLDIEKLLVDVTNGDVKAINTFARDIKKPSEEGSLLKAYMFNRLGLTQLAQDEQMKIRGGGITSEMMGGEFYTVEKNARGEIVRAWNSDGASLNRDKVAQLQSSGQKTGTHAFSTTGGVYTIPEGEPDAGQEYARRFSAQTGQFENVITSGPNANKPYVGKPGYEKRVETNAAVKLNDAYIDFKTKPTIAMATTMLELAGKVDDGKNNAINNAMAEIQRRSPAIFNQVSPLAPTITGKPPTAAPAPAATTEVTPPAARPAATTGAVSPQQVQAQAAAPAVTRPAPSGGGGTSLLAQSTQIPESIKTQEEVKRAELKPPAEAKGKNAAQDINNQRFADEAYTSIRPIAELVKKSTGSGLGAKVDTLAGFFGKGTEGAQAIAQLEPLVYPLVANVPRFQGSQSDYDVKMYQKAAGDFANAEKPIATRLAALKGMISLLKKYDKEGKNDWEFGGESPAGGGIRIISRERVQ